MTQSAEDRRRTTRRRWIVWLLVVLAVIGPIYGRALLQSRSELRRGHELFDGDPYRAVTAYRHAVEWYAPLNPFSAEAADRLFELGMAEPDRQVGQTDEIVALDSALTLRALESLRTGILVTRSVYTPYADMLPPVEQRIATMRGHEAALRTGAEPEAEISRQLQLLQASRARAPNAWWSLIATIAFVLWLALTGLFIRDAFGGDSGRKRRAMFFGMAAAASLATWILGLFLV